MSDYEPSLRQSMAIREFLSEAVTPLIEDVLVKKLGQAMSFLKEQSKQNIGALGMPVNTPVTPPKKEWVGLTGEEARKFYEKYTNREELIYAIDKFLEEKNT